MKKILQTILTLVIAGFETEEIAAVQTEIDELKSAIDALPDEETEPVVTEEVTNKINDLAKKFTDKSKVARIENQIATLTQLQVEAHAAKIRNSFEAKNPAKKSKMRFENYLADGFKNGALKQGRSNIGEYFNSLSAVQEEAIEPHSVYQEVIMQELAQESFLGALMYLGINDITVPVEKYTRTNDAENAKGHDRLTEKDEQEPVIQSVSLTSGELYKKLTLSYSALRKGSPLVNYRLRELPIRWLDKLAAAILEKGLTTDGTQRVVPINRAATDDYVTVVTAAGAIPTLKEVMQAANTVKDKHLAYVVANRSTITAISERLLATGGTPTWYSKEELAAVLGVAKVVENADVTENNVIIFDPTGYGVVGTNGYETLSDYDISVNGDEVEVIGLAGGNLIKCQSAAVVKPAVA